MFNTGISGKLMLYLSKKDLELERYLQLINCQLCWQHWCYLRSFQVLVLNSVLFKCVSHTRDMLAMSLVGPTMCSSRGWKHHLTLHVYLSKSKIFTLKGSNYWYLIDTVNCVIWSNTCQFFVDWNDSRIVDFSSVFSFNNMA